MTTNLTHYYAAALAKRDAQREQVLGVVVHLLKRVTTEAAMPERSFRFWSSNQPRPTPEDALHSRGDGEWRLGVEPYFAQNAEPTRDMTIYLGVRFDKDNRAVVSVGDTKDLREDAAVDAVIQAIKSRIDAVMME